MTIMVFDSSCLCPFAKAQRLDELRRYTEGFDRKTTRAVFDEIRRGMNEHPVLEQVLHLDWLETVAVDGLEELIVFSELKERLGKGPRDIGEASVLAWAEVNGGVAVLDDGAGRNLARERGILHRGSLFVLAQAVRMGLEQLEVAATIVDLLVAAGARLPCKGDDFEAWCRRNGLL